MGDRPACSASAWTTLPPRSRGCFSIGDLSTIGVYGDQQGRRIDEPCAPNPIGRSSRERLAAERQRLALGQRCAVATHVFPSRGSTAPAGATRSPPCRPVARSGS